MLLGLLEEINIMRKAVTENSHQIYIYIYNPHIVRRWVHESERAYVREREREKKK